MLSASFLTTASLLTLQLAITTAAQSFAGEATFFSNRPGAPGACGVGFTDNEFIAAVSQDLFKGFADPSFCGKKAKVTFKGKTITVVLIDSCPGCKPTSLDLSPVAFKALEDPDIGVIPIQWSLDGSDSPEPTPNFPETISPEQTNQPDSQTDFPTDTADFPETISPEQTNQPDSQTDFPTAPCTESTDAPFETEATLLSDESDDDNTDNEQDDEPEQDDATGQSSESQPQDTNSTDTSKNGQPCNDQSNDASLVRRSLWRRR
ncbi:hypothetical protein BATDEDRAFT_37156 [Batrachochytrium dendrobatidis JAM81]|uniref:RlpA-like protein double-psi beta-barrel domain-containing protein n=1 Tax=Batrachochytrium dendrobatidis (strain JAM81 / FGSC 10211) TaxID=684364 RepID=F4P6G0_BATDJ|nr:uncharacterized protein BATDEDRAFT_37156 [Batrachochytrium dendrobatidis JAM81]EGF79341.1 hypothetical protein BATDEDRAFT_37156 [Batrachochytrium dendrobatidis JAM81]|eukprot:XP_006680031.1 hypothetical protein BATDEDRAFT_37156 [Batrachochytrium dendrobatidis JAM81]